jgi:hypothetical protein
MTNDEQDANDGKEWSEMDITDLKEQVACTDLLPSTETPGSAAISSIEQGT